MTDREHDATHDNETKLYIRFGAMILTSMVVMYAVMYLNTFSWSHVQWSETRLYMTLLMGGSMALVMLAFMIGMYRNRRLNWLIVSLAAVVLVSATWMVRSQELVQETSYMSAMIPHHSIAILTSERSEIADLRVCRLAVDISEAQRREIAEMEWLISDISANGPATTEEAAAARPVPEFPGSAIRTCPG